MVWSGILGSRLGIIRRCRDKQGGPRHWCDWQGSIMGLSAWMERRGTREIASKINQFSIHTRTQESSMCAIQFNLVNIIYTTFCARYYAGQRRHREGDI